METEPGRRCCAKRGRKGLQVSGQSAVAAVDRIVNPGDKMVTETVG